MYSTDVLILANRMTCYVYVGDEWLAGTGPGRGPVQTVKFVVKKTPYTCRFCRGGASMYNAVFMWMHARRGGE